MAEHQYIYHEMNGVDTVGTFDSTAVTFQPDHRSGGKYDNGDGHASKSFWDAVTGRRIMWSWVSGGFPCTNQQKLPCDSMQSVPREIVYSAALDTLIINPVAEVAKLRTGRLAVASGVRLGPNPTAVQGAHGATLDVLLNFSCSAKSQAGSVCSGAVRLRVSDNGAAYIEVGFSAVHGTPGRKGIVTITQVGGLGNRPLCRPGNASMCSERGSATAIPVMAAVPSSSASKTGPNERRNARKTGTGNPLNNTNLQHGDIDNVILPANTTNSDGVAACTAYCADKASCKAWVFVRQGYERGPR